MSGAGGPTREQLWLALAANALVVPGLGSLLAGRRCGWAQAALAAAGFVMTLCWLSLVVADWTQAGALPATVPRARLLGAGVLLFAAAWVWALHTAVARLRARPDGA